ncbi:MAG: lipase family protein [Treponema sp.]|nr:lipase family protein [Candidatus Treponema equifaecale]
MIAAVSIAAVFSLKSFSETFELYLDMPSEKNRSISIPVEFEDSWLLSRSSYEYNHGLARVASFFSDAAYSTVDAKDSDDNNIVRNFLAMGFDRSRIELHYNVNYSSSLWGNDQVAFSIAMKEVRSAGGKKNIIVVVVRGTPFNSNEWLSNLNIGNSKRSEEAVHRGFAIASSLVYSTLKSFMLKNNVTFENSSILITGHSRGAAVSNLTAEEIYRDGLCPPERIFAYTFASPNTTTNQDAGNPKYGFIFNIVNAEDVVPTVPFNRNEWRFRKFGVTKALVNYTNMDQEKYDGSVVPRVSEVYRKFVGRDYAPFRTGPFVPSFITLVFQYYTNNVEKFYKHGGLYEKFSSLMGKLFPDYEDSIVKKAPHAFLHNLYEMVSRRTDGFIQYLELAFNDMHSMEVYFSFMAALDEKEAFSDLGYTTLVVRGSQEFSLFNEDGIPLCRVIEGLFIYRDMKLPVVGTSAISEYVIVGFPANMNFKVMVEDETLISSPSKVYLEHYDSAGVYEKSTDVQKVYTRIFKTSVFDVGVKTYKAEGIESEMWNYSQSKKMIRDGRLNSGMDPFVTAEFLYSSNNSISFDFIAGIPYIYALAGIGYKYEKSWLQDSIHGVNVVAGVGTIIPIWRIIDVDVDLLPKVCFPYGSSPGDFVYMTELRTAVSARILGTMRVMFGVNIDFEHSENEVHKSAFVGLRF